MSRYRKAKNALTASVLFYFLMAATILLMQLTTRIREKSLVYALGVSFWLFLILGLGFALLAASRVKAGMTAQGRLQEWKSQPVGLLAFGKNRPALVFDILCVLSILGTVIGAFTALKTKYIMYVLIFLAAFSFAMHCLLNGRTLLYLESIRKVRKSSYAKH